VFFIGAKVCDITHFFVFGARVRDITHFGVAKMDHLILFKKWVINF